MRSGWIVLLAGMIVVVILGFGCANKYLTSGKIAMNSKNWDKAIHDFNLALEENSANAEAHFLIGKAYKEKGDYILMNQHYTKAEALDQKYKGQTDMARLEIWGKLFTEGTQNAKDEKWQEALSSFQTAIAIMPNKYEAYTNAGYVWQNLAIVDSTHIDSTSIDSAYVYYASALELDRTNIKVLENFADINYGMGKVKEADSLYSIILEADPNNAEALVRKGEIADQQGRYESAIDFYNRALQLDPKNCNLWFNLGVIYFQRLKKLEDAEQAFSRAASECPEDINAHINLNVVLITQDKLDDAITHLNEFTQQHPNECTGWDLLSQALLRKGQKEKALEANKKYEECKKTQ